MRKCTTATTLKWYALNHFLMINFDVLLNLDCSINCHSVIWLVFNLGESVLRKILLTVFPSFDTKSSIAPLFLRLSISRQNPSGQK
jgi:hypothetical protein